MKVDIFKPEQRVVVVRVENKNMVSASGPFTIDDINLFTNTVYLKECGDVFQTSGISCDGNKKNYSFLIPFSEEVLC